ncbi:iron-sulfur cluster carrier protein ApbC [Vineibacter terrae]|uniref:iron-sulfur cluster carrier protein ApbC n=1 Tax=Vineibacter terrae TaxID=2586908 RepID=UPI002E349962|nr:iron-sulfur cluster carrier protein ApbC [Vineibacter terrae]HEX2889026.1 iron-sulfur cluster carrier protein ApbC [Vineibacter terrae]
MAEIDRKAVEAALAAVMAPDGARSVVAAGLIDGIATRGGHVQFALKVDPALGPRLEQLRLACEAAVKALPDVKSVTAVMTAERPAARAPQPAHGHAHGPRPAGGPAQQPILATGIDKIIAVASGKGGVGKSTTAVNLALGLAALGRKVGILDADIYGPSMPRMLKVTEKPDSKDGNKLLPIERFGLKTMSIGYLVSEETPMIWRGPMVQSALEQMLRDVEWGTLDVLVVDMPPGTGDAQLTMAQRVKLAGAVIVSTPQDIALIDARKGLNMFRKTAVPVLGIVENMSYFLCPHCGERSDIFGHGGAQHEAERLGVPFLGAVPLHLDIRIHSDDGNPIVAAQPDSEHARIYRAIAQRVWDGLQGGSQRPAPRIVIK